MEKLKLLIDTDIGDEIDDALALYLAMRIDMEIVGVTTVYQNTDERARIAKRLMSLYGKGYENVPVYAGCATPLCSRDGEYPHTCHYTSELDSDQYAPNRGGAVDFIIDCCKKHGKELTVVAIGPFTNLAKAIEKDPSALGMAKKVVIMGGAYFKQYADWNVMCDVEAADLIFSSLSNLECVGADVTHRLPLSKEQMQALCNCKIDNAAIEISRLVSLWQSANPDRFPALHDPLAVYYAARPDICKMAEQRISVITDGMARGLTLNVDEYDKSHLNPSYNEGSKINRALVAKDVDPESFINIFMNLFI